MKKNYQKIQNPLFYRLLDDETGKLNDEQAMNVMTLKSLQDDIKCNIQSVLNNRINVFFIENENIEVNDSVLMYGMPDYTQPQFSLKQYQQLLAQKIQKIITYFEPRLQQVKVMVIDSGTDYERNLHLRIMGEINLKPNPKTAVFDTNLDMVNHIFDVYEVLE